MNQQDAEILEHLKRCVANFFSVSHVSTFQCYRNAKSGGVQHVRVEIWDNGPGESNRYHAIAITEDGRKASGNSGSTIQEAIAFVHWWDLDKEPSDNPEGLNQRGP